MSKTKKRADDCPITLLNPALHAMDSKKEKQNETKHSRKRQALLLFF